MVMSPGVGFASSVFVRFAVISRHLRRVTRPTNFIQTLRRRCAFWHGPASNRKFRPKTALFGVATLILGRDLSQLKPFRIRLIGLWNRRFPIIFS